MTGEVDTAVGISSDQDGAQAVKDLTQLILATNDSREVMRLVRQRLREILPYQRLSILFHNEASHYFYVDADLSSHRRLHSGATILHEADTGLTEILATRRSMLRTCAAGVRLTAAERQFFGDQFICDLAVPMLIGERVLGIFHFVGDRASGFSQRDQDAAEEIAAFATLALERSRLLEYAQRKKDEAGWWRDRYYRMFRAASEAISLVNWKDDLIYESNSQFARMSGRSDADLHGMHFTEIFSPESRAEVRVAFNKVEHTDQTSIKEVQLLRKGGGRVPARLTLFQIPSRRAVAIAVLQDLRRDGRQHLDARRRSHDLLEMVKAWRDLSQHVSVEEILTATIDRLGEIFKARYIAAFLSDKNSSEPKLAQARNIGHSKDDMAEQPWLAGIGEGPFGELLAENEVVTIPDVFVDPRFMRWRPIAEKLGYTSLVTMPLLAKDHTVGLLCLFFERSHRCNEDEQDFLRVVAAYLTMAIDNRQLFDEASAHAKQIAVINEITRSINSSLDMREVIRITTLETKRVIDFDLASISLFDEGEENLQMLAVASRRLAERVQEARAIGQRQNGASGALVWLPFYDGAALGWLKGKCRPHDAPTIPRSWLRSEMNALLLSQERFLGTLALCSLEAKAYSLADREFLKQIAGQMAIAIGNARLFGDVQQRVSEFSTLAELSNSISGSLKIEDILKQIMKAVVRTLGVRGCRMQLLGEEFTFAELQCGTFPALDWLAIGDHRQTLVEKAQPVVIKNLAEYLPGVAHGIGHVQKISGALLAHPVTSRDRVIGVLYAWWDEARAISRHKIELVTTIIGQAVSAIENARMYKESLVNTKQLEKVNEELENFVFTVSHDLKSPIVSIQGFTSIMLGEYKHRLDETSLHYLERIQGNANQMERLIADLLELSRIGRVVNPFAEVPALDIINRALADFALPLDEKKIHLQIQENLPVIWCDSQRLSQVFTNLIGNAIKFTGDQPQPQIGIGCADKGSHFLFSVKDNGIGIDEKYHEKIFGLFQGLHQLKGVEGTGVGLTIVRRIIENHGGKVWVESSEGNGATFYFTLPKKPPSTVALSSGVESSI